MRQGFKGTTETLNVNSKDMPSVEAAVTAKLQQDPAVDHIMALDASIALTAVQSKANAGSDAVIDTFDTNAELVTAIKNGDVGWAIDQQPFLQGYLAIDALWLYLNNRNIIGGGTPVLTRARVHRREQRRLHRRVCRQGHPLAGYIASGSEQVRTPGSRRRGRRAATFCLPAYRNRA